MSSVMGSARGTYTPDCVLLLQPVTAEDLAEPDDKGKISDEAKKNAEAELRQLFAAGKNPLWLKIVKGRDGVKRESFRLTFHFRQTRFVIDGEPE